MKVPGLRAFPLRIGWDNIVGDCFDGSGPLTELEFVRALNDRDPGGCLGPLIAVPLSQSWLLTVQEAVADPIAVTLLRDSAISGEWIGDLTGEWVGELAGESIYSMCAAHWLDIAALISMNSRRLDNEMWARLASWFLINICQAAGWDPKEVSNLLIWRRVPLT